MTKGEGGERRSQERKYCQGSQYEGHLLLLSPLYSIEWGTPLHFCSLPAEVCVDTVLESVCVCEGATWTCHSSLWEPEQAAGRG